MRISSAYDRQVKQDLSQIETQLDALATRDRELAAPTRQQVQQVVELVGRFKRQTANSLLELEQEIKQVRDVVAQAAKKQTELETQKLDIEKSKLRLERWQLVVGLVTAFLTGLLFPIVLWLVGVKP